MYTCTQPAAASCRRRKLRSCKIKVASVDMGPGGGDVARSSSSEVMVMATASATTLTQLITTSPSRRTRFGSVLGAQHMPEPQTPEHGRDDVRHPRAGSVRGI